MLQHTRRKACLREIRREKRDQQQATSLATATVLLERRERKNGRSKDRFPNSRFPVTYSALKKSSPTSNNQVKDDVAERTGFPESVEGTSGGNWISHGGTYQNANVSNEEPIARREKSKRPFGVETFESKSLGIKAHLQKPFKTMQARHNQLETHRTESAKLPYNVI
jgi:hypothetical protein